MVVTKDSQEEYHLLSGDDNESGSRFSSPSPNTRCYRKTQGVVANRWLWKLSYVVVGLWLIFSTLINFILCLRLRGLGQVGESSPYLNLRYTQTQTMWWNTDFSNMSTTDAQLDELWDTRIPWETGIIALTNEEAEKMALPESQSWPWDASAKKIYIVNAHYLLHCVRNIYISIQQYRKNKPQSINYAHILHCLDSLRTETMCSADDTLRYIPLNSDGRGFRPGDGQPRKCRDWKRVEEFVESHDPCYRYLEPGNKDLNNLERFKFCPADSRYITTIRDYFGYSDDWTPEPQEGPRELEWVKE